jgi:hypothetical protein
MNKENIKKKGGHIAIIFFVGLVTLLLYTSVFSNIKIKDEPQWHILWEGSLAEATEANPGAGASGFLEIFFCNHSADPANAYNDNVSSNFETWCNTSLDADGAAGTVNHAYAAADNFNLTVKSLTVMDVVCRARWNRTHAYDGTKFIGDNCRINITMAGGGITILGTTSGTNVISENQTDETYIWINVYWNNAHAGYQLNPNSISLVSQISIQAKY